MNYETHLDSLFLEIHFEGQLLTQHYVRVVRLVERGLQLLQLLLGEDGAMATLPLRRRTMSQMAQAEMMLCMMRQMRMWMRVMRMMRMMAMCAESSGGGCSSAMPTDVRLHLGGGDVGDGCSVHVIRIEVGVGHCRG